MVTGGEASLCWEAEMEGKAGPVERLACIGCCKDSAAAGVPDPALLGLGGVALEFPTTTSSVKPSRATELATDQIVRAPSLQTEVVD